MRLEIVTLFPDLFPPILGASILGRARKAGQVEYGVVNPRDFSKDRHRKVDDRPYGGGPGMVLMPQPLHDALKSVRQKNSHVVFLSPQGKKFDQKAAQRLSRVKHLILVCGHYEGLDARLNGFFDEEISIGDYVLTGGELPALVVTDAVVRLIPGVLSAGSAEAESFSGDLLDHPHYTRPRSWRGRRVPTVLFSGDHKRIAEWRARAARRATKAKRPDIIKNQAPH